MYAYTQPAATPEDHRATARRKPLDRKTPKAQLASFYFFYFAVMGVVVPYWSPYLHSIGFSPDAIGELMAIFMGARIVAPMLMGLAADSTGRPMALVRMAAVGGALCFAMVFLGRSYRLLAGSMAAFGLFYASALPPFEAVTLNHLGEGVERYGRIRLWGSLGFIVAVVGIGHLLEMTSVGWVPRVIQVFFVVLALAAMTIPRSPSPPSPRFDRSFWTLLKDKRVVALLFVGLANQMGHGPYYVFFTIRLEEVGYAKSAIGPLWAIGVIAEIGLFFWMTKLLPRFGPRKLLIAALALGALRWNMIALFVDEPVILASSQLLHAASFGIVHAVTIHLIHKMFVGHTQSRGQALYAAMGFGAGGVAGSLFAGYAWASVGPAATYHLASLFPALASLVALLWVRQPSGKAAHGPG